MVANEGEYMEKDIAIHVQNYYSQIMCKTVRAKCYHLLVTHQTLIIRHGWTLYQHYLPLHEALRDSDGDQIQTDPIRSSDNDSTSLWPPGSLHTLGTDGHIQQRDWLFMWIKILCIEYILWGIPTIESTFDVANMVKTTTVKDVPINNDALLNIQAC